MPSNHCLPFRLLLAAAHPSVLLHHAETLAVQRSVRLQEIVQASCLSFTSNLLLAVGSSIGTMVVLGKPNPNLRCAGGRLQAAHLVEGCQRCLKRSPF
jgi:hypothetical protein